LSDTLALQAAKHFASKFGYEAAGVWSAPGRVNLIGEHTDYNEGFVLPFAINRRTYAAVGVRSDSKVRVASTLASEAVEVELAAITAASASGWSAYPLGVLWAMHEKTGAWGVGLDIFIDSEDKNSKTIDHIFTEIEIFGNQFFSGEIKQNFGGRLNLGYEIKGLRIYGSGGYVASTFDYQEEKNSKQSIISSAPFYGIGLGYDLTKTISLRLNSMFYNLDFNPKNSEFKSVEVDVSSVNLGLALNF
jgi:hypothetical protein